MYDQSTKTLKGGSKRQHNEELIICNICQIFENRQINEYGKCGMHGRAEKSGWEA